MNRVRNVAALAACATLIVVLLLPRGSHPTRPAPARGDRDRPTDCWAHPDRTGRRHCSTRQDG